MIRSFRSPQTGRLFRGERVKGFEAVARAAQRKLAMLDAAVELRDLAAAPGNRLEKLAGDRAGQYSIRINGRWRLCFAWRDAGA